MSLVGGTIIYEFKDGVSIVLDVEIPTISASVAISSSGAGSSDVSRLLAFINSGRTNN